MKRPSPHDVGAIFAAMVMFALIGVVFCALMWFGSLWAVHQEDHDPEQEFMHPKEACR
jgi:hypothetical protein